MYIKTKDQINPGTLLKATWGCTMSYTDYYQVVSVNGNRVELGVPLCKGEGNQEGYTWIEGVNPNPVITRRAKFTKSGLKLCTRTPDWLSPEAAKKVMWKVGDSHWDYLKAAEVGERDYFHGD